MHNLLTIIVCVLFSLSSHKSYSQSTIIISTGTVSIYSGMPTTNFNGSSLTVGDNSGNEYRTLLKFDLSNIPACATITNADLRISYYTGSSCANPTNIRAYRITSSWNATTVTWNTSLSWNSNSYFSWWPSYSGYYEDLSVTDLVNDWLTLGNNGVLLKKNAGTGCSEFFQLNSINPPILLVTYTTGTISTNPSSITASPNPICSGSSCTLTVSGGSLGTGASWKWYSGSCGGILVGTGSSISVSPSSTTTYYVRAEGTCNTTSCLSASVNVHTSSGAPTGVSANPDPLCSGNSSILTVIGGSLGTGASRKWYSGSCGGTPVGTGSSISVSPSTTTIYYVRAEGTCNTTACASVTISVNTSSTAPTSISATSNPVCSGNSTTFT